MIGAYFGRLRSLSRRFRRDDSGTIVILTAFLLPVAAFVMGMGIDYSNALRTQTRLSTALDAALLATARDLSIGDIDEAQVNTRVNSYFAANLQGSNLDNTQWSEVVTSVDESNGTVTGTVDADVSAAFAKLLKTPTIGVKVDGEVTYNILDLEIALVLDVTGSMSGQKLADMKDAAKDLIDILMAENQDHGDEHKVRISLVPYSDLVNVGSYEEKITGYNSGESCVYERPRPHAFKDVAPVGKQSGQGNDDNGSTDYSWGGCTNRWSKPINNNAKNYRGFACGNPALMPMTTDRDALKTRINSFTASGCTAGHIGIQWGWNTLSPNWADVWPDESEPRDYDTIKNVKIMIVMTDGSFNTWFENGQGSSISQSKKLCRNIKDEGVFIYSVAFQAPRNAENLMRQCASGTDYYFNATSGAALRQAFEEIANRIRALRLSS